MWAVFTRGVPGETYLVGADGERDSITVMRDILAAMGHAPKAFDWVRDRLSRGRRYVIDSSMLRRELGWEPRGNELGVARFCLQLILRTQCFVVRLGSGGV